MTRTMTMTLKTVGTGRGADMARSRAQGTDIVRRVVGFAILSSGFVALLTQVLAHIAGH
ncbi:hypothetical protein [Burkholderia sp. Ax-1719]|jgi:hypothetical protein|uniref:hypothetical protein n=1 Tax=Burkholderia sp. Ax-1719 TaxID=2608334 RepID=UPI001422F0AD|nr:hypothetical protein [Burkholderia sp. Ax-1719]